MLNARELKACIVRKGYTQEAIAKEIGITARTMSSKVRGKSEFGVDEATKIKELLNLTADEMDNIFFARQ